MCLVLRGMGLGVETSELEPWEANKIKGGEHVRKECKINSPHRQKHLYILQ